MKNCFGRLFFKSLIVLLIGISLPNALCAASDFYRFSIPWDRDPGFQKTYWWPLVISGDGQVGAGTSICSTKEDDLYYCPFRVTKEGGITEIQPSRDISIFIADTNNDGSVLVGRGECEIAGICEYFTYIMLWTEEYGWETLLSEDVSENVWGDTYGEATGVSDDGSTVTGRLGDYIGIDSVFIWKESTGLVDLGLPAPECSGLAGTYLRISGDGQTLAIGCEASYDDRSGDLISEEGLARWTEQDGLERLGQGFPTDISTDGTVIVGIAPDGRAFRYTDAAGFQDIGPFRPSAGSADASIIVGEQYVWDELNGLQNIRDYLRLKGIDVDAEEMVIDSVDDISDDGSVLIGIGYMNGSNSPQGWIATLDKKVTVVDNQDERFSEVGTWHVADKAAGYYSTNYAYAYGGDGSSAATFTFEIPVDGSYRIAAQWPEHRSRAPDAPFTLINNGVVLDAVRVDQRIDGGRFSPLAGPGAGSAGAYDLSAGVLEVTLTNDAAGKVAADAVRVVQLEETVIDNRDAGFSKVGSWHAADKAVGFYGTDYVYAYGGDGSSVATFTFEIPVDGSYRIAAQWPAHRSRAPDAPFALINNGTVVDTVRVDQRTGGGGFNPLAGPGAGGAGVYTLGAGVLQVILTNDAAGKVAADAVQVVNLGSAGN